MPASRLRTLFVLGRVSNLPTVWSNCGTAWLLAGGGAWESLALLLASASCLYLAGMFLNDACDAAYDQKHRPERPIPSGLISRRAVGAWALGGLLAGGMLAIPLGGQALGCALALLGTIVAYDLWHKRHPIALGLMAGCRFLLYIFAGVAAAGPARPYLWTAALGLAGYVLGISLLARHESGSGRPPKWPIALLALPGLAAAWNASQAAAPMLLAMALFAVWLLAALAPLFRAKPPTGQVVGRLLAGIVLADGLQVAAVAPAWTHAAVWAGLFGLALLLQRRILAT